MNDSAESHGFGAVQNDKAIVAVIILFNIVGDVLPILRCHIGRVD